MGKKVLEELPSSNHLNIKPNGSMGKKVLEEWPSSNHLNIKPNESLPPGLQLEWKMWRCLNRLHSGVARTKTELKKCGFADPSTSVICKCGNKNDTIQHRLTCSLLDKPCSIADLCNFNERARRCVKLWQTL